MGSTACGCRAAVLRGRDGYRALKKANIQSGQRLAIFGGRVWPSGSTDRAGARHRSYGGRLIGRKARTGAAGWRDARVERSGQRCSKGNSEARRRTRGAGGLGGEGGVRRGVLAFAALACCWWWAGRPEPICFPALSMAGREVRVQASSVGTRENLRDALAMAAAGKLKCRVAARPLAEANEVLEELRRGQVAGRIVLQS